MTPMRRYFYVCVAHRDVQDAKALSLAWRRTTGRLGIFKMSVLFLLISLSHVTIFKLFFKNLTTSRFNFLRVWYHRSSGVHVSTP